MTKTALGIVLAVLLLVGGFLGYRKYEDSQRTKHDVAVGKVEVFTGDVAVLKDSLKLLRATLAGKDSALVRANRPRPTGPTRIVYLPDTARPGIARDSTAYVPQSDYDLLGMRYDSLSVAVTQYREAVTPMIEGQRRTIAAQDSVIKYQRVVINTPKPFRRWSIGIGPGYGFALVRGRVEQAPALIASLTYRIF